MKLCFSHPFRLFFVSLRYCPLLIARYYAVNNNTNTSKNNSKSIHEKIQNNF